jgi:hypothetical protein
MALDEVVDRARRDAVDVALPDDGDESRLRGAPQLKEARQVAPLPELRDCQLDPRGPGLPIPVAVAVAVLLSKRGSHAFQAPVSSSTAASSGDLLGRIQTREKTPGLVCDIKTRRTYSLVEVSSDSTHQHVRR